MRNLLIVLVAFLIYYGVKEYFGDLMKSADMVFHSRAVSYFIVYLVIGTPLFLATLLIRKEGTVISALGVGKGALTGLVAALIFSIPMFIGGMIFYTLTSGISVERLLMATVFAGSFEELYYRGFLFGMLFRFTNLGFIPSVLLSAVLFASGHVYQSPDFTTATGIFLTTFIGAFFFAWLYAEWQLNLWVPIFLHTFMNLAWEIFSVSDNALGGLTSNLFRAMTIALAIILTLIYQRKKEIPLSVSRSTLWRKS